MCDGGAAGEGAAAIDVGPRRSAAATIRSVEKRKGKSPI